MEVAPPAEGTPSEGEVMACPSERESMFGMVSRHRREILELRNKELDLKKAAARGSKAEQKAKKKQVEDEIVQLQSRLKSKHSEELASMGYIDTPGEYKGNLNNLVMALAGVSVTGPSESSKPSKGAKRRGRRAQQEAAREQRIQEEQGDIISDRMLEDAKLEEKLEPLGLAVNEIRPDGHCLYRAVEHQLLLDSGTASHYSYLELRKMAADYMRENSADFHPFFQAEEGTNGSPSESFKQYCDEVESTAAWGGQLELGALAHCLKRHILIYSGSFPDVEMGTEYKSEEGRGRSDRSIMLSYHVHAYGLGEHYNSVVPDLNG